MNKLFLLCSLLCSCTLWAQFIETDLQIRPRFEYRNGYKTFLAEDEAPAAFISQRSRIGFRYVSNDLQVKFSGQSVGVWGDSPTMRLEDRHEFSVFEAYGQYTSSSFMLRFGRQILSYDNQRILGEVNWAQQGQSHDAFRISWRPADNHRLDLAFAYNAEAESLFQIPYLVDSYQNMQFAWYHVNLSNSGISFLLMNTGYEYDTLPEAREIGYLQTYGTYYNFVSSRLSGDLAIYGQTGFSHKRHLTAWYTGVNFNYRINDTWISGLGAEFLSGTNMYSDPEECLSFTPLFGTNHGFNGYMDYFYVGNHLNSVGLVDLSGRLAFTKPQCEVALMPHIFSSEAKIVDARGNVLRKYLGTEIDIAAVYKPKKDLQIHFGYSQMFGTIGLEVLKGAEVDEIQNWGWLMLSFSPELFRYSRAEPASPDVL